MNSPFKISLTILALFLQISCGQNSSEQENNKKETRQETAKETVEIHIKAVGDDMSALAFEPKTINIPENAIVELSLSNMSTAPGMLHNFVLVQLGAGQEVATAGLKAGKSKQFVPNDNRVVCATKIADLGETVTLTFNAPAKGSYHFICTYPGHFPMMIGRLNVV